MEYYNVFIKVLLKEIEKFHLNLEVYSTQVTQLTVEQLTEEDFNGSYSRCAYMYRHATAYLRAFNTCIKKFFSEYFNTKDIFSVWKSFSEVKVCSLSVGPGIDYLGFMLAVLEYDPILPHFTGVKVVSKHGGWRNTVKLLKEVLSEQGSAFEVLCSKYQNVSVTQADLLTSFLTSTKITAVCEANVILMMKTLNFLSSNPIEERPTVHMLEELVSSLESGTIIFCYDTKPSIAVLTEVLSHYPGQFLHNPSQQAVKVPGDFPELSGIRPTTKVRGTFFVWQKSPRPSNSNLCATALKNVSVGTENKVDNLIASNSGDKPKAYDFKTEVKVKETDDNSSLPWIELKSFWKDSSPKTKASLRKLMLVNDEDLGKLNDLVSKYENLAVEDISSLKEETHILNTSQTAKLEYSKVLSIPSQSKTLDLSLDQKIPVDNCYGLHSYNNRCPLSSDTLGSVSSFTCENMFSDISVQQSTDALAISSETLHNYNKLSENNSMKTDTKESFMPKENYLKISSTENKITQTDTFLDIPTPLPSVKALTDRIRQLAISLESVSQHNDPTNSSGCEFFPLNQHNEGPANHTHSTDKPTCSQQSPSFSFKEQGSLPSYHNNAPCQNMLGHYSCQCSHNRCMNCHFQPDCAQPIPRCSFACNHQQSRESNLANVALPNIVIPLQNISDNALLQIISILKSDSKN